MAKLMGNPVNQNVSASFSCDPERIHLFSDTCNIELGLASVYYNSLEIVITTIIITHNYTILKELLTTSVNMFIAILKEL